MRVGRFSGLRRGLSFHNPNAHLGIVGSFGLADGHRQRLLGLVQSQQGSHGGQKHVVAMELIHGLYSRRGPACCFSLRRTARARTEESASGEMGFDTESLTTRRIIISMRSCDAPSARLSLRLEY